MYLAPVGFVEDLEFKGDPGAEWSEKITSDKVVVKWRYGFGGKEVELFEKEDRELKNKLAKIIEKYNEVVVLEYIPSGKSGDIRVTMLDGKILVTQWRTPPRGGWIANIDLGGTGKKYKINKDEEQLQ